MKSQDGIATFKHWQHQIVSDFIPICYQTQIHRCEDNCHGNVQAYIANATPHDRLQVRQLLDHGFASLRQRPDLLTGSIRAARMPV